MGSIAREVGLARSSLYRYFPNKSAIVQRWFETVMGPLIEQSEGIAQSDRSRAQRFTDWVELQIDYLSDPANQVMIRAALESDELDDEQRSSIGARHRKLYASLHSIIAGPDLIDDRLVSTRILLVVGLLRNLGGLATDDVPHELVRTELVRAATLIADIDRP